MLWKQHSMVKQQGKRMSVYGRYQFLDKALLNMCSLDWFVVSSTQSACLVKYNMHGNSHSTNCISLDIRDFFVSAIDPGYWFFTLLDIVFHVVQHMRLAGIIIRSSDIFI